MLRAIRALIRKTFGKNHSMKTQGSSITLVICLGFIVAIFAYFGSFLQYIMNPSQQATYAQNIIIVNPPDSWEWFEGRFKETYEVSLAGDGAFYYREADAVYDVFTFSKWMKELDAKLVVVFPKDFDEIAFQQVPSEKPEILTYYSPDHFEYATEQMDFTEYTLGQDYLQFIQEKNNVPIEERGCVGIRTEALGENRSMAHMAADRFSRMVVPLLFFIVILYVGMLSGMNAIAGEKERSTFAAILMTPVPRLAIVLGNYIGVFLHALIPCAVLLFPILFFVKLQGIIGTFMLVISLALFISAVTVMISCLNNTIVSAQTTFLPIFLILLVVCVTCMQENTRNPVNPFLPIYGHFYGIGDCLMGTFSWNAILVTVGLTLFMTVVCIIVSERLLQTEAFTVAVETKSEKELRRALRELEKQKKDYVSSARANVFGYVPKKRKSLRAFLVGHASLPLVLVSFCQTLAMIPAVISFMKSPRSTKFVRKFVDLTSISQISEATKASLKLFAAFMQNTYFVFFMAIGYWLIIGFYILLVKYREKNPISTLGFADIGKENAVKAYLKGLFQGFVLISSVYVLLLVLGQATCNGFSLGADSILLFFAYVLMWIPQGATEELMMRGYMMPRVASRLGVPFAIFFSSMCFSLMHATNPGFSILALFNLAFIAAFFAVVAYKSEHIYTVCAMHTVWNFCQGNLFGLEVSGNSGTASILSSSYKDSAVSLLTGGDFGPEGGLCVTIVIAIAFAVFFIQKKKESGKM